jgi:hypothetical protein
VKIQENVPIPQVNTDWNATGGVAQILNKPSFFPANHLQMRPATGNINTWLEAAQPGMYYMFASNQQTNQPPNQPPQAAFSYIGFKTYYTEMQYSNIIAIEYGTPHDDISKVFIKRCLAGNWSSWQHIGNGSNAATLEGKRASDFVTVNSSDGKIPSNLLNLSDLLTGQIIKQSTEPEIPNESFAFWIDGSDFYLILNSSGVQKKLQLQ